MSEIGTSLTAVFDYVWDRFTGRLAGLTDDEYFWEPVADCWTLRQDADGRWVLDGGGGFGPAPDPAPVTTIAWRTGHVVGLCVGRFGDRLFGDGQLWAGGIDPPGTTTELPAFLDENYARWRPGLAAASDDDLGLPLGPAWGIYAEHSRTDLALHVLDELVHHAAEIGLLRDLYARR
ncbi:MAG TPA: DinB family protein [Acidimicrobiales bacterium]|nr:DinB family protein [Acidimicrobiales bacterium]